MPSSAPGRPAWAVMVRSAKLCSSRDNAMTSPLTDIQAFISVIGCGFGVKGGRASVGSAGTDWGRAVGGAGTGVGGTKPIRGEVVWDEGGGEGGCDRGGGWARGRGEEWL